MTEEAVGNQPGAEASATLDNGGLAVDLALGEARHDPALRGDVSAFLRNQNSLIDIQKHHLHKTFALGLWEKRLGVLLRIATAFTGLAIAAGLAFMIWNAANSDELIVDAFSVPPDLAARGLTGQAVAAELVDQLADMQARTTSNRASQSFANSFGDGIKLEIPETGISLSELDRFLREKLGHDTHISGEVIRTAAGLVLKARAGALGHAKIQGPENDSDMLVQQLAGEIFKLTQPYRYGIYLGIQGHQAEAIAHFKALAKTGPSEERAWDNVGIGTYTIEQEGNDPALVYYNRAQILDPQNILAQNNLGTTSERQGRSEQAMQAMQKGLSLISGQGAQKVRADYIPFLRQAMQAAIAASHGAFHDAAQIVVLARAEPGARGSNGVSESLARYQAGEHDLAAARATMANPLGEDLGRIGLQNFTSIWANMFIDSKAEDWRGVLANSPALESLSQKYPGIASNFPAITAPLIAYAQARMGHFADAERRIAPTPGDCYPCLRMRGQIAALQRQNARADWWFDRAVKAAPSLPFAESEWGEALLQRGDTVGAIAKFKLANQKGPHFADPLEGWGEALMAQNRSDLALAKFAEAEKYAPRWGRLHLKWGEALGYAGKKDEAQKQFALSATLDLMAAEAAELTRESSHG